MASSDESDLKFESTSLKTLFSNIPFSYFDARKYCYANGDAIAEGAETVTKIKHEIAKFEYTIDVGNVTKSGIYLVGEFIGDVLVTRAGIRGVRSYYGRPEVKVELLVRKGNACNSDETIKALQHWQFLRTNTSTSRMDDYVDWGRYVHIRAHAGYCLEAKVTMKGDVTLKELEIFIRVQCTERVGGAYDHPSWSPENVASGGAIKSETKYCKYKYPDDREDVLTRSLFNN